jgi:hypothetical protein
VGDATSGPVQISVPSFGVQVIQLTQAQSRVGVAISNAVKVIAQLLVNGRAKSSR